MNTGEVAARINTKRAFKWFLRRSNESLYKANNPTATGYEIKGNKVGDINIEDILFEDSKLKEYLTEAQPSAF